MKVCQQTIRRTFWQYKHALVFIPYKLSSSSFDASPTERCEFET